MCWGMSKGKDRSDAMSHVSLPLSHVAGQLRRLARIKLHIDGSRSRNPLPDASRARRECQTLLLPVPLASGLAPTAAAQTIPTADTGAQVAPPEIPGGLALTNGSTPIRSLRPLVVGNMTFHTGGTVMLGRG